MNSIYDVKSINQMYKIFYNSYNKITSNVKYELVNDKDIYKRFWKALNGSGSLDFKFATSYLKRCKYTYYFYNEKLNMYVFTIKTLNKKDVLFLSNLMKRIRIIQKLYGINKIFNIYILMNPQKRYLPLKGLIDTKHINGGFTYILGNDIYIIRKEDCDKVLIHEVLHHNQSINVDDWKYKNIQTLKHHFHIHNSCRLFPNEAVIETFACVINLIFYSLETGINYKILLKKEILHSLEIYKKIKDFQNTKLWQEKTNTFCYIILKSIFYVYFDKFIKIFRYTDQEYDDDNMTLFLIKYSKILNYRTKSISYNDRFLKMTCFK